MIQPSANLLLIEVLEKNDSANILVPGQERFWRVKVLAFGEKVREAIGIEIKVSDTLICNPLPELDREVIDPEHPTAKLISATQVLGRVV